MKNSIRIWCPASVANINVGFDALGFCLSDAGDEIIAERVDSPGVHLGELKGFPTPISPKKMWPMWQLTRFIELPKNRISEFD